MLRIWPWAHGSSDTAHEESRKLEQMLEAARRNAFSSDPDTEARRRLLFEALDAGERESEREEVQTAGNVRGVTPAPGRPPGRRRKPLLGDGVAAFPRPAVVFALGAVALLVVATSYWLNRPQMLGYETGRGEGSLVTLADSTQISLNHTSKLTVIHRPLKGVREVALAGEAFFEVRRNGAPFIVQTTVGTVRVLGTEFNVRVRDQHLEVAVIRGSVSVTSRQHDRDSTVFLTAGQIATCMEGSFPSAPAALPFSGYPGWKHGELFFYKTDMAAACREIEARFDVNVRIEERDPLRPDGTGLERQERGRPGSNRTALQAGPDADRQTITGKVDGRSAEAALRTLALLTGKQCLHENESYILR